MIPGSIINVLMIQSMGLAYRPLVTALKAINMMRTKIIGFDKKRLNKTLLSNQDRHISGILMFEYFITSLKQLKYIGINMILRIVSGK